MPPLALCPDEAPLASVKVRSSPSKSVAATVPRTTPSESGSATVMPPIGLELIRLMVTVTDTSTTPPCASLRVTVKVSVPPCDRAARVGVYM